MKQIIRAVSLVVYFCFFLSSAFNIVVLLGAYDAIMNNNHILLLLWVISVLFAFKMSILLDRWFQHLHH